MIRYAIFCFIKNVRSYTTDILAFHAVKVESQVTRTANIFPVMQYNLFYLITQMSLLTWTNKHSLNTHCVGSIPYRYITLMMNNIRKLNFILKKWPSRLRVNRHLSSRINAPVLLGLYSLRKRRLTVIGIRIINLRRSDDRLGFIIGIHILIKRRLLSE